MDVSRTKICAYLDKVSEWSLYISVFVLPFSKSLLEIMFVIALVSIVVKKLLTGERLFERNTTNLFLLVYVLAALVSFLNTAYFPQSLKALFSKSLKFALLFVIVQDVIDTRKKLDNLLIMGLISCVIIIIDAFIQYFVTHIDILHLYPSFQYSDPTLLSPAIAHAPYPYGFLGFPTASFPFPNDFAAWILIFIFPVGAFALLKGERPWKRLLCAASFLCLLYFFVMTKTRSAWIGLTLSLCLAPLFIKRFDIKKVGIIIMVLIALSPFIIKKSLIPHILSFSSMADRNTMWQNGWKIFVKHPVIGNGLNTFYMEYMQVREDEYKGKKGGYAHNCYLQMAAETGVIGLAAFLCFVTSIFARVYRSVRFIEDPRCRALAPAFALGLAAFLVHSFFDTNLYSLNLSFLFWMSAGLLLAVIKIPKTKDV